MDRNPEDLQFLGIVGIVREAFQILRSCAKLLGAITVTLILPLSFAILGHQFVSDNLQYKTHWFLMFYHVVTGRAVGGRSTSELTFAWTELFVFLAAYTVFVFAYSLLSTAAVVYTVASIYTRKEISYGRVMSIVPRVWKRLMVTFLWFFIIDFAYYTASVSVFLLLIYASIMNKLNSGFLIFGHILITIVFSCFHVYISMVWQLACVISVLEDKYGLGAMRKSNDLIKGKRITALALVVTYLIFCGIIGVFFWYDVLIGENHGVRSAASGAYGTVFVGLLCFVHLMGLLTQSVFYFACKSYHHETIDKSSLSDHLEAYLGDYAPLESSDVQLAELSGSVGSV